MKYFICDMMRWNW